MFWIIECKRKQCVWRIIVLEWMSLLAEWLTVGGQRANSSSSNKNGIKRNARLFNITQCVHVHSRWLIPTRRLLLKTYADACPPLWIVERTLDYPFTAGSKTGFHVVYMAFEMFTFIAELSIQLYQSWTRKQFLFLLALLMAGWIESSHTHLT